MQCRDARSLIDASDEPPDDRLARHLAACSACTSYRSSLAALEAALRSRRLVDPAPGFRDRVMAAVDAEPDRAPAWSRPLLSLATVLIGTLAMLSGLTVLWRGWTEAVDAAAAAPAVQLAQLSIGVLGVLIQRLDGGLLGALLSGVVAVTLAVAWFGVLVLPRSGVQPVRARR
jgi:hypothetical protein